MDKVEDLKLWIGELIEDMDKIDKEIGRLQHKKRMNSYLMSKFDKKRNYLIQNI